ncbi:MAG: serine protease [Pseudomonadota bacterium]
MSRLLSIFLYVALLFVAPFAAAEGRFDESRLTPGDVRILQSALAFEGVYHGRVDGRWGAGSREALAKATSGPVTEWSAVRTLLPLLQDLEPGGWRVFNPERGTSMFLPYALLSMDQGADFVELSTPSRDLIVRHIFRTPRQTAEMHTWLENAHRGAGFYRADTPDAFISAGDVPSGRVYLRSRQAGWQMETVLVQYKPRQRSRAQLIIASLTDDELAPLGIPQSGYIDQILTASREADGPEGASSRSAEPKLVGSGTGFFVNPRDMVTAHHVVDGCARLTLADGTGVTVVAMEQASDLAIIRAERTSDRWLTLGRGQGARLGRNVVAIGYPYAGLFQQGLSATRGNISALRGLDGADDFMMLTAPVQPGNSGGPILSEAGEVLGVVSYRASERFTLDSSGTLPQNMNAGTRLVALRGFLEREGIKLPIRRGAGPTDLSSGLPEAVTDAVHRILCHGPT